MMFLNSRRRRSKLPVVALLLALCSLGFLSSEEKLEPAEITAKLLAQKESASRAHLSGEREDLGRAMHSVGPQDAVVVISVFSDFQSDAAWAVNRQIHQIRTQYPDHVRVDFRHFTGAREREFRLTLAYGAAAAGRMGYFWVFHDALFNRRGALHKDSLAEVVRELGLDEAVFSGHLNSALVHDAVDAEVALGERLGLVRPPGVFVNGHRFSDRSLGSNALQRVVHEHATGRHRIPQKARGLKSMGGS